MKFLQNLLLNIAILSLIFAPVAFASNTYRGIAPTYSVDFLQNTSDQKGDIGSATVNRVSGVWSADSTGKLVALRGDRTNYIQRSWQFDSTTAYWTATNANANTQNISAFGVSTATYLKNSGGNGSHSLKKNNEAFNGRYAWYTIHAKSVDYNWIRIDVADGGETNGYTHYFDMSNGVFGTGAAIGAGSLIRAYSDNTGLSAGEYRIGILVDLSAIYTTCDLYIYVAEADGDVTINDDGKGIYIYGAQLEALEGPEAIPGDELIVNGDFSAVTKAAAKNVTGITKANPGVVTFAAAHGYSNGMVIYFSGLTEMTELNGKYFMLRSNAGDTFQLSNQPIGTWDTASLDTSGYVAAETTGGACAQRATATALTIYAANFGPGVNGAGALTGKLDCNGSAANGSAFLGVVKNATHIMELSFTLSNYTSGSFRARLGGATCVTATVTSDGTYTARGVGADHLYLDMMTTPFIGSIDNVTLKEISAPGGYDDGWEPGPYTATAGAIATVPSNVGITPYGAGHAGGQMINYAIRSRVLNGANWTASVNMAVGTGTGIDGQTGFYIKLTSSAANQTLIADAITVPSAVTNCTSVYVKRVSGAGKFYITDNNGTNYTEVTGITDSTWTRKYITRSQASVQMGFKIEDSGDSFLVDCSEIIYNQAYPSLYWVGIPDGDNTSPVGMTTEAGSATNGYYHTMSAAFKAIYNTGGSGTTYVKLKMGHTETDVASGTYGFVVFTANTASVFTLTAVNLQSRDGTNTAQIANPAWTYGGILELCVIHSSSTGKFCIGYSWNGAAWVWVAEVTYDGAFTLGTFLQWFYSNNYPMWVEKFDVYNRALATTWVEAHY